MSAHRPVKWEEPTEAVLQKPARGRRNLLPSGRGGCQPYSLSLAVASSTEGHRWHHRRASCFVRSPSPHSLPGHEFPNLRVHFLSHPTASLLHSQVSDVPLGGCAQAMPSFLCISSR